MNFLHVRHPSREKPKCTGQPALGLGGEENGAADPNQLNGTYRAQPGRSVHNSLLDNWLLQPPPVRADVGGESVVKATTGSIRMTTAFPDNVLVPFTNHGHSWPFPAQPVLGPCFSTGRQACRTTSFWHCRRSPLTPSETSLTEHTHRTFSI